MKDSLILKLQKKMAKVTFDGIAKLVLKNEKKNRKFIKYGESIKILRNFDFNKKKIAIIVGAGPSLEKVNQIKIIQQYKNKAIIIACDCSLYFLLRNDILPDLIVTLDPHATRIIRLFGDLNLSKKKILKDDYFKRQDLDKGFANQIYANKKIIKLMNKFSKKLNFAICSSSSLPVTKRLFNAKCNLFWWNPLLDDPNQKKSLSRKIFMKNKLPLINSGGNVGAAAWMIADSVLYCDKIALVGMDLSYYNNTSYKSTQYYDKLIKIFGKKNLHLFYIKIYNPIIKKYFYTDHAYLWYKKCFLEMLSNTSSRTTNCTGAGILFEKKNLEWQSLKNFCKANL